MPSEQSFIPSEQFLDTRGGVHKLTYMPQTSSPSCGHMPSEQSCIPSEQFLDTRGGAHKLNVKTLVLSADVTIGTLLRNHHYNKTTKELMDCSQYIVSRILT